MHNPNHSPGSYCLSNVHITCPLYACESFGSLQIPTSPKVISLMYQKCTMIYFTIIFNDATILCNAISQTLNTRLF